MHAAAYVGDTESINALIQAGEEGGKGWKGWKDREREGGDYNYVQILNQTCVFFDRW